MLAMDYEDIKRDLLHEARRQFSGNKERYIAEYSPNNSVESALNIAAWVLGETELNYGDRFAIADTVRYCIWNTSVNEMLEERGYDVATMIKQGVPGDYLNAIIDTLRTRRDVEAKLATSIINYIGCNLVVLPCGKVVTPELLNQYTDQPLADNVAMAMPYGYTAQQYYDAYADNYEGEHEQTWEPYSLTPQL